MLPRILTPLFYSLLIPLQAGAAGFYKHVDENGVVTYSNRTSEQTSAMTEEQTSVQQLQMALQHELLRLLLEQNTPTKIRAETDETLYIFPWRTKRAYMTQGPNGHFSHHTIKSRYAVDIALPVGSAIHAARAGTVIQLHDQQTGHQGHPAGNFIRIRHSDGTQSAYLHLQANSTNVRMGQYVAQGDYLANSGNTGNSTGPHLHFVVQRVHNGFLESIPFEFSEPIPTLPNFAAGDKP